MVLANASRQFRRARQLVGLGLAAQSVASAGPERKLRAQRALSGEMARAKGLAMKLGQWLATSEADDPYAELIRSVEPLELTRVLPILTRELGTPWDQVFAWVEPSEKAASLGQVHEARTRAGEHVALKLQYPHIAEDLGAELALIGHLPNIGPARRWEFDLSSYKAMFADQLLAELDYEREAKTQAAFARGLRIPGVVVPRVLPAYTSHCLLVSEWQAGTPLCEWASASGQIRDGLGERLLATVFAGFWGLGAVHADPHAGNFAARLGACGAPELVVYDFGSVYQVPQAVALASLKLVLGLIDGDDTDPFACLVAAGFDAVRLERIRKELPMLCRLLFEPLLVQRRYALSEWNLSARMQGLLGEARWHFRAAAPPAWLWLLRSIAGVVARLGELGCALDWWKILESVVNRAVFDDARRFTPPAVAATPPFVFSAVAKSLNVSVRSPEREEVALVLPVSAVLDLEAIVPSDVQRLLSAAGNSVELIQQRIVASGVCPQDIIDCEVGTKSVRVWLA